MEIKYIAKCKPLDKHRFSTKIESKTLRRAVTRIRKESQLLGVDDYVWRVFAEINGEQHLLISGGHKFGNYFHQEWGNREYTDDGEWLPERFDDLKKGRAIWGEGVACIYVGLASQPSEYLTALAKRKASYIANHPDKVFPGEHNSISFFTNYYPELIGIAEYQQQPDGTWSYKWNEEQATI